MKRLFSAIAGFFLFFIFSIPVVHAEEIVDFTATINIQPDGTILVSEKILYDFEKLQKHGIFRSIPYTKINSEGKKFTMSLSDISVTDESGLPYNFTISTENDYKKLKIGDADKTITGRHVYTIGYTVSGSISYFSDHDELYWNVTGNDWTVPIRSVAVTIHFPSPILPKTTQLVCYTGVKGSSSQQCQTSYQGNHSVFISSTAKLSDGEGLTAIVGFPKGIVAVIEPKLVDTRTSSFLEIFLAAAFIIAGFFWYIGLPLWIVFHWVRRGRDPKPIMGEPHVWFAAPKNKTGKRDLTPAEVGTVIDETADLKDITGTLIDLARRGYFKIVETKKDDFSFVKKNPSPSRDTLLSFERILFDGIFGAKDAVRIKDGSFVSTVAQTNKSLYDFVVSEKYFLKNPEETRTKFTILGSIGVLTANFPLALAAFLFGRQMPRKTLDGVAVASTGRALKHFLVSQNKQFAFQAKKQLLFEKMLPYAVVFGVEKIWADRFSEFNITSPDWYEGRNMSTFNSVLFVDAMTSSMRSFTSSATPTSSSSGFTSGFSSGGGFSGGGGGGGGGGSW